MIQHDVALCGRVGVLFPCRSSGQEAFEIKIRGPRREVSQADKAKELHSVGAVQGTAATMGIRVGRGMRGR